ncbi:Kinesin protein [Fasciola hepatica]|uniref:Kinesin-like protein n=1 Tax=Fasciola hepatica TaxID=6192 RepID=A0A4E0RCX2_FASHE|nr:Kinesin protein [Fasciola hepatica]
MASRTKTYVRIRPSEAGSPSKLLTIEKDEKTLSLRTDRDQKPNGFVNSQQTRWQFKVERVFFNVSQDKIYSDVAEEFITAGLSGIQGTLLCYGQTGAGKTYTMSGISQSYPDRGIIPRALEHLFSEMDKKSQPNITARVSYIEIYNEQLYDLLIAGGLQSKQSVALTIADSQDQVWVKGLSTPVVRNLDEAFNYLFEGELNRAVAPHALNRYSSRAHTIFTIHLIISDPSDSDGSIKLSRINFVDLAGSERIRKTQSTGQLFKEATHINRSLTFLEQTVLALSDPTRAHIPYRQSKLTHLLRNSIGGNNLTTFIANIWDEERFLEESISTLRFASRTTKIPCQPISNVQYDLLATVKQLKKENEILKQELLMYDTLHNCADTNYDPLTEQEKQQVRTHVVKYLDGEVNDLQIMNLRQLKEIFMAFRQINRALQIQVDELRQKAPNQTSSLDSVSVTGPSGSTVSGSRTVNIRGTNKMKTTGASGPTEINGTTSSQTMVGELDLSSGQGLAPGDRIVDGKMPAIHPESSFLQLKRSDHRKSVVPQSDIPGNSQRRQSQETENTSQWPEPPSKIEAFEIFKDEPGRELFKIFKDNRAVYAEKRKEALVIAEHVNHLKATLEKLHLKMNEVRDEREAQGLNRTSEGAPILTEEEFNMANEIHVLRQQYAQKWSDWQKQRQITQYCRHVLDLSRSRLVQEFHTWYNGCFGDQSANPSLDRSTGKNLGFDLLDRPPTRIQNQADGQRVSAADPMIQFELAQSSAFRMQPGAGVYERVKEAVIHRRVRESLSKAPKQNSSLPQTAYISES